MHALETIHAALRPNGLLLNVHPEVDHRWIEARVAGEIARLGQLDETQNIRDVEMGRVGLRTAIDMGLFAVEHEARFTFMTYFDSVDAWLAYMAQPSCGAVASPDLVARAREALPAGAAGDVRMRRVIYAGTLRRVG